MVGAAILQGIVKPNKMDEGFANGLVFSMLTQDMATPYPVYEFAPPTTALAATTTDTTSNPSTSVAVGTSDNTESTAVGTNTEVETADKSFGEGSVRDMYTKMVTDFIRSDSGAETDILRAAIEGTQIVDRPKLRKTGGIVEAVKKIAGTADSIGYMVETSGLGYTIEPPPMKKATRTAPKDKITDESNFVVNDVFVEQPQKGVAIIHVPHTPEKEPKNVIDLANTEMHGMRSYDVAVNNYVFIVANVMQPAAKAVPAMSGEQPASLKMHKVNFNTPNIFVKNDGIRLCTPFQRTLALAKGWRWYADNVSDKHFAQKLESMYVLGQQDDFAAKQATPLGS